MKKKILLLLFILFSVISYAQKEAAIWYFGENAGLDFNSGTPVPLNDGELVTQEGCAAISDFNGNLLFYTDGITIWNRNHVPMPNGNGLLGHPSSTQSGIIVPQPGNPNQYYVFTVDESGFANGLQYNVVDMTLNGGLGDVTIKNQPLQTPVLEKLTAVSHDNGTDIWVLAHGYGNDTFYAYLVTPAGLVTAPVTTNVGHDYPILPNGEGTRGYMKVSPDGTKVIMAGARFIEILQFNSTTGVFSNPIELTNGFQPPPFLWGIIHYGAEFSSDSNMLYLTSTYFNGTGNRDDTIDQFEVNVHDQNTIFNSRVRITSINRTEIGALQLAIDGKIYASIFDENYLGVINNPNAKGTAANFVQNGVTLTTGTCRLGLPPFIQSFFIVGLTAEHFCFGDATEFSVSSSDPITSILWDFGDGTTSVLENPNHTYTAPGDYTVSVTINTASDTKLETKDITIFNTPIANTATDIEICSEELTTIFDFSTKDMEVLGGQSLADYTLSYHASMADAQTGGNALNNLYTNTNLQETIYARIQNNENTTCYDITSFDVLVKQLPIPSAIEDTIVVCDDDGDGQFAFNLAAMRVGLLADENPVFSEVSFHSTQADADNSTNPLPDSYTNTLAVETIVFRMQNQIYPECFVTGEINLQVIGRVIANTPANIELCDANNDGQVLFNLAQTETEIIGTQTASSLNVSFHETQTDADTGVNLLDANTYTSTANETAIYVRVENALDSSCFDTTSFLLNIYATPVAPQIANWLVCDDDNDGNYLFDLTDKNTEILNGNSEMAVTYYESQADADMAQNAIIGTYQNTMNPQNIYFRLENSNNATCFDVSSFQLEIFDTPTANTPTDIIMCDVNEIGQYSFNLSEKDIEVLNGQDETIYLVSYHATDLDAMNNENPLSKTAYENLTNNDEIWVRIVHHQLDFCYDVTSFNLIINALPEPNIEEQYVICPDSPELIINGGVFDTYLWRNADNVVVGSQQELEINELGEYSLTVSRTTNGVLCENTALFEVFSSGAPDSFTVDISGFSDTIILTINALAVGEIEYSIDGLTYQSSNVFEVFPGEYTLYVRDLLECRLITQDIIALGYRKFFTPNGDDYNEYWNVIGGALFPNSRLTIYDRYGKLIQQLEVEGAGWDGTYLGQQMPASDYWFRYEYDNGKVFTGHFALKR